MLQGLLMLLILQTPPASTQAAPAPAAAPDTLVLVSYVPQRVFESRKKKFTDFESMLAELAKADIVLLGEQHDDRNTHRLELAVLEGLMRRRGQLTLSLEMFERDAQQPLSAYLAGSLDEGQFLQQSRPWPRYASDYRPLIEFARAHGWPVIASNVPRRLASQVSKEGLGALGKLPASDRGYVAHEIDCPADEYRKRFVATIGEHPLPGTEKMGADERNALTERFYQAQCIKDETMAESIAAASGPGHPLIVHYTGSFHSDYRLGTAERVGRRLKDAKVVVVSILPVDNLDALKPSKDDRKLADYLLYTLRPQPSPHERQ